jgi:dihydrolipoamide dehydrogenase
MENAIYDLVVIGAGPGGYIAAARAGALGLKVAVVEKDSQLGGTCLHRGCIPTKAMLHAADVITEIKEASRMGVMVEGVKVDWDKVLGHKRQVVKSNAGGVAHLMKSRKVDVVTGFGRVDFSGGNKRVIVKGADGKESTLATKNVCLAVGSKPRELPFAKFDGERIISSDHIHEIPKIPGSLAILGGGVIGIEFASLFARMGTKVTVLEMLPRIVAPADPEASKLLADELGKQGCEIKTSVKVTGIERKGDQVFTAYQNEDGTTATLTTEYILIAVGRPPLTQGIGLETTKAQTDKAGFVVTDGMMQTAEPGLFAIGDCVNTPWLAHVASAEGMIVAEFIAHQQGKSETAPAALNYDHTPSCVYSEPPMAWSGLTEEEARKRGHAVKVSKFDFAKNAKSAILLKKRGFVKFITDEKYGEILGCHIVGPQATDLLAEPALAISAELPIEELARTVHAHPTLYEAIWEAACMAVGRNAHG